MDTPTQKNAISFSVTAEKEVDQDFITISFSAAESGSDPNKIQAELAKKLKLALDVVRPKKVDGEVNVQNGNFQIRPSYDKKGAINGYYGSVQLIVSGTDTKTVAGLTGEISTMTVQDVQHSISPALRKSVESELTLQAIQKWRDAGSVYVSAFSARTSELIGADISINNGYRGARAFGVRTMAASAPMGGGAMEEESGKETLTATVTGSLQLIY